VEGHVNEAIGRIEALPFVRSTITRIRMETLA